MISENFKKAYENLNPRQREAVDAIDGPVMVIAGPGTGKTQILTLRIANILAKTDTAPENILALTFTESAAANMRQRLVDLIGTKGYYVEISTFHGFANRLIQEYPEFFPEITGSRSATDIDQIGIIRRIIEENNFECLKPFGDKFYYIKDILPAIRQIKQEGYSPEVFSTVVKERRKKFDSDPDLYHEKGAHKGKMKVEHQKRLQNMEKNLELATIYEEYEKALRAEKLYDFEDMILSVVRAFREREEFLLQAQEKAQYILVDEHQDTNGAQNNLLELLASFYEHPNLFVVGDEKQAIYRFQGASLENFLYFQRKYSAAKLIYLEDNYRSTQTILDSAQSVIDNNASTLRSPLTAKRDYEQKKIRVVGADFPEAEYLYLAHRIKDQINSAVPPEEIAVLYRENREAEPIAAALEREGIPFSIESDSNILVDPDIQKFIKLLVAIHDLGNDEKLVHALHIDFLGIPPLDIYRLLEQRVERDYVSLYSLISKEAVLMSMGLEAPEKLFALYKQLEHWKRRSRNELFLTFFVDVVGESGLLAHLLAHPGYFEKVGKLNALFDEAKKAVGNRGDYGLEDFINYLTILREHNVMIRKGISYLPHAVRLMTAHKSKGLEFDHVYIFGVCDGRWGNKRRKDRFDLPFTTAVDASELERNEDERRLFYMAITRARKDVTILYSSRAENGKELVPSQFIAEIRSELKEDVHATEEEAEFAAHKEMIFAPRKTDAPAIEDSAFLKELFRKRGFSVTALNNYLECPWRYFYTNLLRLPQAQTVHQIYGIAVHAALQRFFDAKRLGEEVGIDYILERFEEGLLRHPLPKDDLARLLRDGRQTLSAYFKHYSPIWNYRTLTEYNIKGVKLTEDIILTGKLDKLELTDKPNEVVVVDYKVKQPDSRNSIEGKTLSSNGNYKRQLVFYKLLLDNDGERSLKMREAVIDFVEPNERGIFKQEAFEITAAEVEELKELVIKTGNEILSLEFWDKGCGEKDCEYCALRAMLARGREGIRPILT